MGSFGDPHPLEERKDSRIEGLERQVRAREIGLREAVTYMRNCGPASDPAAWHAFMEKYDPDYEQSTEGRARRALEHGKRPAGN